MKFLNMFYSAIYAVLDMVFLFFMIITMSYNDSGLLLTFIYLCIILTNVTMLCYMSIRTGHRETVLNSELGFCCKALGSFLYWIILWCKCIPFFVDSSYHAVMTA